MEDLIEKASPKYQIGDTHPTQPWTYVMTPSGKEDWRATKSKIVQSYLQSLGGGTPTPAHVPSTPGKPTAAQIANAKANGKAVKMSDDKTIAWAKKTDENVLVNFVNNTKSVGNQRKIAYEELESRGYDISTLNTSGTLDEIWKQDAKLAKMLGNGATTTPVVTNTSGTSTDDDDDDDETKKDEHGYTKLDGNWWADEKNPTIKKLFNTANSRSGRIKYDKFLDKKKRGEKGYKNAVRVMNDLARTYSYFLKTPTVNFAISAGGAGIGKTYQFKFLAEHFNYAPFDAAKNTPGDGDYDYFEAPDCGSAKQLANILKSHNGKLILFDDNDKCLTDARMSSMMKKATATSDKRIVDDPDDKTINFEFTGRIMVMTNKDISTLNENLDTKAIISRAIGGVSEIYLTIPETLEVLENRFQDMEFYSVKRLDDPVKDEIERNEVFEVIKENADKIDPRNFTIRNFEAMINARRAVELGNELSDDATLAKMLGSYKTDWRIEAAHILSKGEQNQFGNFDDEMSLEKAEDLLLYEEVEKSFDEDMSIGDAEDLLLN